MLFKDSKQGGSYETPIMPSTIKSTPASALVDEPVRTVITDLEHGQTVTISARTEDNGMRFYSYGYYKADQNKEVDLEKQPCLGGTWKGIEPMGFIYSMKQEAGQPRGLRLIKRDVTTPLVIHLQVFDGSIDPLDGGNYETLAQTKIKRLYKAPGVKRVPVTENGLVGTFFVPEGNGPFPGVLDLFGTIGGCVEHRAALMASRGIATLALEYFNPKSDQMLITDLEYFEKALDFIAKHPVVDSTSGLGVVGVSLGSEIAMLLSVACPKVKAVVAINGVHFVSFLDFRYKDKIFYSVPFPEYPMSERDDGKIVFGFEYTEQVLQFTKPYEFESEKSSAKFLIVCAADDHSTNPMSSRLMAQRLRDHGRGGDVELLEYPGTGHLLEPPYSPVFIESYHGSFGSMAIWGGDPPLHNKAQVDSWNRILKHFHTHLSVSTDTNCQTLSKL